MLAWVVIYRRHLRHSCKSRLPKALDAKGAIPPSHSPRSSVFPLQHSNAQAFQPANAFFFASSSRSPYPPAPTPSTSLPTIALSPLPATLMELPQVLQTKGLAVWLNPLDATLTKNRGWGQSRAIGRLQFIRPYLPSSVHSSKFRISQPLCLPLLRELPGVYQQFPFQNSHSPLLTRHSQFHPLGVSYG
jgi:hypothetical protein